MENGEAGIQLPSIIIGWDEEAKTAHLGFDKENFKNFEFVLAVLNIATQQVEAMKRAAQLQQMQQQMQEAQQAAIIRSNLRR